MAQPIQIGVSIPLSGEGSIYGAEIRDFFEFANQDLANNKYKLIFEDDKCDSKTGLTVAQKLVNIDRIKYVIGFACSNSLLASVNEYKKGDVVAIVSYASSPKIKDAGPNVYRTAPSDAIAGELLGRYILTLNSKKIAAISDQTDYTQDLLSSVTQVLNQSNVKIFNEDYLPNSTDFRSILLRLKTIAPDVLFINPQLENTFLLILNQAHQMNWYPKIVGAYWPSSKTLLDQAKGNADGITFVDTPGLSSILTSDGRKTLDRFIASGRKIRSTESNFATSYEAYRALHQAIQSGEDVKQYLNKTTFNGIFGDWSFDPDGEIQGIGFVIKRIENNVPINVSF
jgi:ABC-type branched-subunit amino acid transport system substrate-binding protein